MGKKDENTGFVCARCGSDVPPAAKSYRNHCPVCLSSVHADREPGDRMSDCGGIMLPVSARVTSPKGIQILHRCLKCGFIRYNMAAEDDNFDLLLKLMS